MNIGRFFAIGPRAAAPDQGKVIYAADVTSPELREAVRALITLVNDPSGNGGSRFRAIKNELTPADLVTATGLIQRQMKGETIGGLARVPELQGLHGLELIEQVKQFYRPGITNDADTSAHPTVNIDTIRYPDIQATARAIAEQFGNVGNPNVIDIGALQRASTILRLQGAASLTSQVPKLTAIPNFKRNIEQLVAFMDRGRNGLADHGPFVVNGIRLQPVFRLAKLPAYFIAKDDKTPESQRLEGVEKMLNEFEQRFQDKSLDHVGYDRVYIDGGDGYLYCGVRNDGDIKDVARGDEGWFMARPLDTPSAFGIAGADPTSLTRNLGTPERTGTVVRIVDVPNTLREAATKSFSNLLLSTFNNAKKRGDDGIPLYVAGGLGPPPIYPGAGVTQPAATGPGLAGWASAIGGTALLTGLGGYAGSFITGGGLLATGALIGAAAAGVIGGAVALYMLTRWLSPQSIAPLWSAAGVSTNRKIIRADEA